MWRLDDDFASAAFGFNFLAGRGAERVGADRQLLGQFAGAENLNAIGRAIGQADGLEGNGIDARAIFKAVQVFNVHADVAGAMRDVVETALGNTADERHLAAFETGADG